MIEDIEVWKKVPRYPHIEASSFGRVRTIDRKVKHSPSGTRFEPGKILSSGVQPNGRLKTSFWVDGKKRSVWTHRLIAEAFLPNDNPNLDVNHIDHNKLNNRPCNLEFISKLENNRHYLNKPGRVPYRDINPAIKIKTKDLPNIFLDLLTNNPETVAKSFGVSKKAILDICNKNHQKYNFDMSILKKYRKPYGRKRKMSKEKHD